ncbi:uncharacterized protein NPIL_30381 [Nephila pilipes]|uniref:Uncharacterized protein n=1 Tax=Nephila pilipes TaxID=299642 RepID=A0A8X6N4R0_NEPPI|nr:uncharacterized protein NPIL_30381 [Nephila pilipes]
MPYIFTVLTVMKIFLVILPHLKLTDCVVCQNFNYVRNDTSVYKDDTLLSNGQINIGNYSCPGTSEPKLHTECCSTPGMKGCCPKARYFYEIDQTLASIIAISVTSSFLLFTIIITICCFWSKCPLSTACRAEYSADIATYVSKENSIDMDAMPSELSGKANNKFSPVVVSNGNLPTNADNNDV